MNANKEQPTINKLLSKSSNQFPVVGIGASAGGLEAFKRLLKAIPENSGMAYVLVQHLDPKHDSLLPELLQKVTVIPVVEILDDIKVKPDHIYIIPSNKMLIANDGVLELSPRQSGKNQRNLPIDLFFSSLAEIHQAHAIGVVLSGTASDGTLGLKAIKAHGGITFAQDEASAAYNGMPHSAVQAGVVDFILTPEEMPKKLLELIQQINSSDEELQNLPKQDEDIFKQILSLLRIRKGTDFTWYKQTTIRRRILRRMALNKNEEAADYLKFLRDNKPEQDVLYQDLLIPVTSFFRDPKVFDNLCESVFPHILKNKRSIDPIRVWVAACSTGEEAYSIAICLKEFLGDKKKAQIFATDLSEPAIAKARTGIYTKSEAEGISPQRLQEFFTKINDSYQLNKPVRDMCVFATHNFLKDPPFGKMDFVSCRNVLIYMEPYLQKKALTTFHYALNPNGFLLLGKSETSGCVPELFASTGKSDKLFTRKAVPGRFMHVASQRSEENFRVLNASSANEKIQTDFQKTADEIMLSKYTPAGVVVNEEMDVVHFRGSTGAYLEPSPGKPSLNVLKMAKGGLAFELRNILHKARKDNAPVIKENIPVLINGSRRNISIEAIPLPNIVEPHYLILFHDHISIGNKQSANSKQQKATTKTKKDEKDLRIQQLEQELAQSRDDMRNITEDQDAANEELQSANEELLSGSEELQSLNEELETSKEELQSSNEELIVINQEMIGLNEQVTESRNYAEAIIATIREPLLVLDKHLRVKTANSAFYKAFQVSEQQTEGVLIYDLGNKQWNIAALRTQLVEILPQKTNFRDFEVRHNFPFIGERIMLLNAHEMIIEKGAEKLILLAMEDITEKARLHIREQEFQKELEEKVKQRTLELSESNVSLQQKNQEIALSKYNKRFLTEFSEKFSAYTLNNEFFDSLVQFIADTTSLDYVFVGKLEKNEKDEFAIQTIAITAFGKLTGNIHYPLPDGPCEQVISGKLYSYPKQCRQIFPKSKTIEQFNVEGYVAYPLNDEQGNAVGLIGVMHGKEIVDVETVTSLLKIVARRAEIELERIKLGEEVAFQNEEKGKRSAELQIANRELVFQNEEKEKRADELIIANKELQAFTYISSHDLQEPLRKIKTFSKLILETEKQNLSDKGKDYFNRMQNAAYRMQTLIEDLLAYSKTSSSERKFENTDLNIIVDEVIVDIAETIQQKNALIEVDSVGEVSINPSQFRQLMHNLIGNALKFSKTGIAPHIIIKSQIAKGGKFKNKKLLPDKNYCHISIADNGIGFDPQYKDRIFEVFQRLHGKDEYEGTGIGLAIVKKIVENHNGIITASGILDKGTTFDIFIPA